MEPKTPNRWAYDLASLGETMARQIILNLNTLWQTKYLSDCRAHIHSRLDLIERAIGGVNAKRD